MTTLNLKSETSIVNFFYILPDPRSSRNQLHSFTDILTIAILAILCGCDDWFEVQTFAEAREDWLRGFLSLESGIPSHDTFRRVFRFLDKNKFAECFIRWTDSLVERTSGRLIAIDGKCLKGSGSDTDSPICMVSAFAENNSLVLGQLATESKSNEITAIPLLIELLDIKSAVVTIDAAGCQKAITQKICEKKGDYVIAVKGNQPTLHDEITNFFEQATAIEFDGVQHDRYSYEERSRDREEKREVFVTDDIDWLPMVKDWSGLKSIALVRTTTMIKEKTSTLDRYYISNLKPNAEQIYKAVRGHWSIGNKLHWILDVAYREDKSKIRKDNGAVNFSLVRRMTANQLRMHKEKLGEKKGSIKVRRKRAGWDKGFLLDVLGVK